MLKSIVPPTRGVLVPILVGLLVGALFLLVADHFLYPPDCAFYWAWAEAPLRQGNFSFSDVYERLQMPTLYVWLTDTGRLSNDWPMGTGVALLPTLVFGPAVSHAWMAFWIVIAFVLWWRGAAFSTSAKTIGLLAALIGTPVLFYGAFGPFFSHPASFAAVTAYIVVWAKTRSQRTSYQWLLLGLLLGFATLVRPQNVMLGLILVADLAPLLRRDSIRKNLVGFTLFAIGAVLTFSPQMLAWWALYGSPFMLPKVEEMHWLTPNLGKLLFSDFHGVLPWTPIYGLAAIGLLLLAARDRALAGGLALVICVQIYLNAANVVWWSGGSFGNRRLGDYAIVIAYAIAALWDVSPEKNVATPSPFFRTGASIAVAACCLWTLTLLLAERRGLLPLDRYVQFNQPGFANAILDTLQQPGESANALLKPLKNAAAQPTTVSTGLWIRILSAALLSFATVVVILGTRRLRRFHARRLAISITALATAITILTAIAALRTTPVENKYVLEIVRKTPGILWDNYIELAYYEIISERPTDAETAARRAMKIRPNHYSNYWYLATALRDQGRDAEAAQAYQRVLDLHPQHPSAAQERNAAKARAAGFAAPDYNL